MRLFILLFAVLIVPEAIAQQGSSSHLVITITGIQADKGELRVAVFNTEESWLDTPVYARVIEVNGDTSEWVIPEIVPGKYGIAVFHDVNSNGENDTNVLGIPKEPYGFSNNARARFGPPSWDSAKFAVTSQASAFIRLN